MFRPRLTRVFRSRWSALWWAATILLLAWRVAAGSAPEQAVATPQQATDPWALDAR